MCYVDALIGNAKRREGWRDRGKEGRKKESFIIDMNEGRWEDHWIPEHGGVKG